MKQCCLSLDSVPASLEPPGSLTLSEIMTICTVFHLSGYRTFKWYYTGLISGQYRDFFPHLVSYNRFVELMPYAALPITFFVCLRGGECTSISFVDSTTLDVCDSHRIRQHKVFEGIAKRGKRCLGNCLRTRAVFPRNYSMRFGMRASS